MNQTALPVDQIRRIDDDAADIAEATYDSLLTLLRGLPTEAWQAPTDCAGWTVADTVGHMIGAAKSNASVREMIRQTVHGVRHKSDFGGNALDATNDLQVRDHVDLTPSQRVAELERMAPKAVAGRMRTPRPLRGLRLPLDFGGSMDGWDGLTLTLGQLQAVVYTRDVWLHRIDIARPLGLPLPRNPELDRRVIEDAVADWAGNHGQPFRLTLHGAISGIYTQGSGGPAYDMDAYEWARAVTRRITCDGLLLTPVLF